MSRGGGVSSFTCKLPVIFPSHRLNDFDSPVGSVAAVVLFIFLNPNPHQSRPLREHLAELDFIGLTFIVLGIVCLLIGFNFGQTSCLLRYTS
jgi:hypothetical protein